MEKIVTGGDIERGLEAGDSKRRLYQDLSDLVRRVRGGRGKGSVVVTRLGENGFEEMAERIRKRDAGNNRR
ncbi:hypothetical protein A2574_03855 [Candidatus Shapirobacteria bacterium RIFOXYD1_FULL_38_32]|uniref:Uncharacterized protein n=2 Tax=Candidatus Shapironibacteriota TaxID=1752721 RepID=A0A0G0JSC7_9BACT|nr:MAG: hypothetical protein US90_C0007G0036 [Candidatus Shapirobacteria bacterium GW2011_GWE2_38_30]OGL56413.1 MAG: hypothetical protein A2195_01910 [Candidatus Shapirobacteria bacterium RIFOXYA1_FULL_39_17]OGL57409.1 MAG: hypothetical protein A2410_01825 [Candidatus Shapirobacteria bacterium RIFOXYC1_FULL_38_24]OGL57697.1 MAG: hypothetical protein A2367_00995 [Candidatus Shapirobacteria bacterium RIFOXYB1_FULL_38_38]OGL57785.1 MAG: hypothetical protein A2574_03855 [Candidatus Shapirobacteria 